MQIVIDIDRFIEIVLTRQINALSFNYLIVIIEHLKIEQKTQMTTPNQETMSLLKQLKHKRFSSQLPSHHITSSQPLISSSSGYGFVCPYHPEFVTNICVSPQSPSAKPLCPRCLQQHINSHQHASTPTTCKLQTCDAQVQSIFHSLTQKITSCDKLKQTISYLDKWQTIQLQQIQSSLTKFKSSLLTQIEKQFTSLQKKVHSKWEAHTKDYNQTVKRLQQTMGNLEEHCQRSLKLINQKKEIDSICSSVGAIHKKYEQLVKVEEKMLGCASVRIEGRFSTSKIGEIVSIVKGSLELKTSKMSGFEIDRIFKEVSLKLAKQEEKTQNSTLNNLQKLFQTNSIKNLYNISDNQYNKQKFSESHNPNEWTENSHERVLVKLNDTTNKLKESLNGFSKNNNLKVYA